MSVRRYAFDDHLPVDAAPSFAPLSPRASKCWDDSGQVKSAGNLHRVTLAIKVSRASGKAAVMEFLSPHTQLGT